MPERVVVADVMRNTEYSGYVGVEYVWIDREHCNEVDNLSETILFRDFLRTKLGTHDVSHRQHNSGPSGCKAHRTCTHFE